MKTTKYKSKEEAEASRKWLVIDGEGQVLGRLASQVASLLRGKHKVDFTPNVDDGDFVIVLNADKVQLTGNKMQQKMYYRHSGYAGGLKSENAASLKERKPEELIRLAVKRMLPRGPLGYQMRTKLKVYVGTEHPHEAQKPEPFNLAA